MTVITFALDTAKICRTIKKTGSSDPYLEQNTLDIKEIFNDVEKVLNQIPTQPTDAEGRLRDLATKCMAYAEDVKKELAYTSPKPSEGFATVRSTARTIRRKGRIDNLTQRLQAAESTMKSSLLAHILSDCMQSKALNISTYDTLSKHHKAFLANTHHIQNLLAEFRASEKTQAYEKLLCSVKYAEMNIRKTSISHRHDETFEWIFPDERSKSGSEADDSGENTDILIEPIGVSASYAKLQRLKEREIPQKVKEAGFLEWLEEDRRCLYWVNGKPGSGKSTFMKFIDNDERTKKALRIWQPKCNIISHFLWKPGTEDQKSLKWMLCSLFYQVLCEERDLALGFLRDDPSLVYRNDITDWDVEDLILLVFKAFRRSSSAYLVLLDGLDELSQPDRGSSKLFPLLESLTAMERIKLCVSSRPERPFSDKFESVPSLSMQDLTHGDIFKYTTDFLGGLQLQPHDELHREICDTVIFKAEGVFIWVYVVLQSIKHGIEQYGETWDAIYDRITKLPPDLLKLYKDMWARLGEVNDRYVKIAARYFQYLRIAFAQDQNIAAISLLTDDSALDTFTRPNAIPCIEKYIKMCQDTAKTLMPVSAGLLEVRPLKRVKAEHHASGSEDKQKLPQWTEDRVEFIHRTAVDFLDSNEGKELFEKHTLGSEHLLSLSVKAQLALRSVTRYETHPLASVWELLSVGNYTEDPLQPDGILPLIHQCAANESRELVRPPYSISHENFFLFEASYHCYYEYVGNFLESSGHYNLTASIYVLIGACGWPFAIVDIPSPYTRYLAIKGFLQKNCQLASKSSNAPKTRSASEGIMLAWRCFLLHELSGKRRFEGIDGKIVEEILEMFIKCGVMLESPGPKYLVAATRGSLHIVKSASDQERVPGYHSCHPQSPVPTISTIYTEVNDAFLLRQLLEKISGTSELASSQGKKASTRPILADNGLNLRTLNTATFFQIKISEDGQESFENWILDVGSRLSDNAFPDEQPSFLQAVDLGELKNTHEALEKIGYDLPAVNKAYDCLHTWC
ncbi:hypothetical protein N8T08_007710 [Aspergillus melleus]|uniref:Uncharacterized protein n=1 Tax=Aspergillus melleus TaxID=138277 RepID=A0ACC3BE08_9EURO|nr:hypothetical protein N8T08_007710 [Aspergillus melleus]